MPGELFLLATIIPFFFYDILNLMLLFFGCKQMVIDLSSLLTNTLNCSAALAMITRLHGERSVNTCGYFNRMYQ